MTATLPIGTRTRLDPDTSDDDLVLATRAGDSSAYGMLWDRHAPAALRAARAITSSIDPEDLVSEAFAKTFSAIRNGGGPTEAFRPYLFAAVRNAAATWGGKQKDLALEYIDELPVDDAEDSLDVLSDKALLTAAFKDLPERWRTLLWYLEVEGMKPREIAPLMGMTPNAVSVLASRAREGFKTAWLHAHIKEPGRDAECRWTCERIVAQGRRRHVPRADRKRFDAHLERCRRCMVASTEVAHASSKLRAVLLPALIGGPAAAAYSAASPAPAIAVSAFGFSRGAAPWLLAGGATVAVAVTVAVVAVAAQLAPATTPGADQAGEAPESTLIVESPAPIAFPATTEAPVAPTTPVAPIVPAPVPEELTPDAAPDPASPTAPEEPLPATPPPGPRSQAQQLPPQEPPEEPVDLPVSIVWSVLPTSTVPSAITGTGAAGGRIEIVDDAGRVIATAIVDPTGAFSASPDGDALSQGMIVVARHTAPITGEQTESDSIGPFFFGVPSLADDSDGVIVRRDADIDGERDDVEMLLHGADGSTVSLSLDGEERARATLVGSSSVVSVLDVRPGLHRVTVRYVDPVTGAFGIVEDDHILVLP